MRAASFHSRPTALALALASTLALVSLVHCAAAPPPPDFLYGPGYAEPAPLPPQAEVEAPPGPTVQSAEVAIGRRVLARSTTRALVTDGVTVFFGDEEQNALMSVPAAGGANPNFVDRPSPLSLALDGRAITWIGRPGNVVRRVARGGPAAVTIRDRGTYTSVAASRGEAFITETVGTRGVLTRVNGLTATQVAAFDTPARGVVVDDQHAYVVTEHDVLRVPRAGGEVVKIAAGDDLGNPQFDRENVYVTAKVASSHGILRVPKRGGEVTRVVNAVRAAPISLYGEELYFFLDSQPELRRVSTTGGAPALVARDEAFQQVTAVAADQFRITVGTERGGIIAVPRAR